MTYAEIVRFHGHECPGLAIGYRMAMAALEGIVVPEPEPARIRQSLSCAFCGEAAMESRLRYIDGKPACIPCCESKEVPHPSTGGSQ